MSVSFQEAPAANLRLLLLTLPPPLSFPPFVRPRDLRCSPQRLKVFPPVQDCVTCGAFNPQGNVFAYAMSYDWGKGAQGYKGPQQQVRACAAFRGEPA